MDHQSSPSNLLSLYLFIDIFCFFCFSISTHSPKWMKCSQSKSKTFIDDKSALRSKPMSIDFIKDGFVLSKIRHLKCYVLLCNNKQWKLPLQVPIKHSLTFSKIKTKQNIIVVDVITSIYTDRVSICGIDYIMRNCFFFLFYFALMYWICTWLHIHCSIWLCILCDSFIAIH